MCLKLRLATEATADGQVERMFATADGDGDGKISFAEFVKLFAADEKKR